ncbi:MAG: SDR family oxidoreductase [Candidatus Caenarcaniphilales bacterium]|nr:SDR family oxidoreductase [Candidatus Caenarcaniphilales bacterium]
MDNFNLKDKVALITGGTSGIGKATAVLFAEAGAQVVVSGRREEQGQQVVSEITAAGGKAKFIKCDVSDESSVKNLIKTTVETFSKLNIAFNNAGIEQDPMLPITETSTQEYQKVMNTNVFGVWLCMKYEIPEMLKSGGGSIINTSSIAGHSGMPGFGVYVASKHAVEGLTKSTALEFADKGIRVNTVSPGAILTDMVERFTGGSDSDMGKSVASMHPMGRMGKPNEIASAVLYLASDASSFTTGTSLSVDGGWLAK